MSTTSHRGSGRSRPASARRVRVLLVDKERAVRRAVRDLLDLDPAVAVAGEAATLAKGRLLIAELRPDVVLLEPELPDGDGLELCRSIPADATRFLILTSDVSAGAMLDAIDAGAAGYIVKDLTGLALADSVKAVAAGESYLDGHATPVLMREFRRRALAER
ncbi:response regulator transcription factor [Nocardia otitidiscaviarum]|uniref:response regulator n=1 Tax=Nocardia otitidiscaviarum TaxID=1823 RepID=UPI0009DD7122|nr:response regulator transcription factor [Nocardia otitidiscaviarum]MBF6132447.1 response regulator transcription factor [Nocardia otitidiscaviarum]MBF6488824.1 response regulator transcription factor [Nocardia otitidiscaviarum]